MRGRRRAFKHDLGRKGPARRILKLARLIILFFLLYVIVNSMLLTTIRIQSVSMEPTLSLGDRLLVSPLSVGPGVPFTHKKLPALRNPSRGDLVVLRPEYYRSRVLTGIFEPLVSFFSFRKATIDRSAKSDLQNAYLVKRVIGIPGDTVRMEDFVLFIKPREVAGYISEFDLIDAEYTITYAPLPTGWDKTLPFSGNVAEITLGEGEYFVLGDNRSASSDSYQWGPLQEDRLIAKVLLRYWPFKRFERP